MIPHQSTLACPLWLSSCFCSCTESSEICDGFYGQDALTSCQKPKCQISMKMFIRLNQNWLKTLQHNQLI